MFGEDSLLELSPPDIAVDATERYLGAKVDPLPPLFVGVVEVVDHVVVECAVRKILDGITDSTRPDDLYRYPADIVIADVYQVHLYVRAEPIVRDV